MSGPKVAHYTISAEQQAAIAARQRRAEAERRWNALRTERARVCAAMRSAALKYGVSAPRATELGELDAVEGEAARQVSDAVAETNALRAELAALVAAGQEKVALSRITGIGAETSARAAERRDARTARPTPAAPPSGDPALQARRELAHLDAEAEVPSGIRDLVEEIGRVSPGSRSVLLSALRDRILDVNRRTRRRRDEETVLLEVEPLARETGDRELGAVLAAARTAFASGDPVDVDRLRRAAKAAGTRQLASWNRAYAEQALVEAFAARGYQVTGVDVHTPESGILLQRNQDDRHAMEVTVDRTGLHLVPVRLVDEGDRTGSGRDEAVEDRAADDVLCRDALAVIASLPTSGVAVGPVRTANVVDKAAERRQDGKAAPAVARRRRPKAAERRIGS